MGKPGDEIEVASPPAIAPQSSAGSISTVAIARQDKTGSRRDGVRGADQEVEPAPAPAEGSHRPQMARMDPSATTAEGSTGGRCCQEDYVARGHFVSRHSNSSIDDAMGDQNLNPTNQYGSRI